MVVLVVMEKEEVMDVDCPFCVIVDGRKFVILDLNVQLICGRDGWDREVCVVYVCVCVDVRPGMWFPDLAFVLI